MDIRVPPQQQRFRSPARHGLDLELTVDPLNCRVLPLVSKAFLEAALNAAPLWRHVQLKLLTLSAERVPCFASWLAAHASSIRTLVLHGRALPTVASALDQCADVLAAALQQATGLLRLELPRALATPLLARLAPLQLPRLATVSVDLGAPGLGSSEGSCRERRRRSRDGGSMGEWEQAIVNLLSLPALTELSIQSTVEVGWVRDRLSLTVQDLGSTQAD